MYRSTSLLYVSVNNANGSRAMGLLGKASELIKGLFTWSGGPRSSGVGFFCFHALEDTKQKKLTPLDGGPPLHVNRVLMTTELKGLMGIKNVELNLLLS